MSAVADLRDELSCVEACDALGVSRASFYRSQPTISIEAPAAESEVKRPKRSHRGLSIAEKERVLAVLHEKRFQDLAVPQVFGQLLDDGEYLCSTRTMYRILEENGEVRERRDQARHPTYSKPELLATAPNQVWSWDITKLRGPRKWSYFYLYVLLDIFSRYAVGWMVASRESAALGKKLVGEAFKRHAIAPGQLTVHADRGSPMTSKSLALLLADLGISKSHNRPYNSNDNPYSEAQFKTLKYRPGYPGRFGCIQDARSFIADTFQWYHYVHLHSGIGMMTPADVHFGRADAIRSKRGATLSAAYELHPERFVHQAPIPLPLPEAVWINKPPSLILEDHEPPASR